MDDAFTIQISGNLVKQLADESEEENQETKTKDTENSIPQQNQAKPTNQKEIHDESQSNPKRCGIPATAGWPPMYLPIPPPANPQVDAIRSVLEDSERVLEKLKKQEEEMVVELEVKQKAKELHDKEFKLPQPKPMAFV
ncbi:hypothetical protein Ccrd_007860 [Cynara cardunculus var. scolymus]|uniref:Uncharacterized protein n=1 Tax=Cynara cardunculus var. scolymus TaxID=59895 RepID=A0A118JTF3_CYNCS|nr:hypothetical protein Ccrd_007860 [Cynara cardunculus var. scolymus]